MIPYRQRFRRLISGAYSSPSFVFSLPLSCLPTLALHTLSIVYPIPTSPLSRCSPPRPQVLASSFARRLDPAPAEQRRKVPTARWLLASVQRPRWTRAGQKSVASLRTRVWRRIVAKTDGRCGAPLGTRTFRYPSRQLTVSRVPPLPSSLSPALLSSSLLFAFHSSPSLLFSFISTFVLPSYPVCFKVSVDTGPLTTNRGIYDLSLRVHALCCPLWGVLGDEEVVCIVGRARTGPGCFRGQKSNGVVTALLRLATNAFQALTANRGPLSPSPNLFRVPTVSSFWFCGMASIRLNTINPCSFLNDLRRRSHWIDPLDLA
ncbi:hypothetical protein MVEN_00499100 [Mycena venus]|uniref:Uncharacterized protein n=1 Tax=Mycena venus TaxID=2733690 RepID=A0A8H7D8I9_9AGAR|nr:hypothetical protein MVEN_00499100 [Mycena venus]